VIVGRNEQAARSEAAVGEYLRALEALKRAPRTRSRRPSPLGKLFRAQGDLARARVDATVDEFIRHGGVWARRERVSARTLREFGVPEDVLRQAGVAPATIEDDVRRWYRRAAFTIHDLSHRAGVSVGTVRAIVAHDVDAGVLIVAGSRSRGRGRPAVTYRLAHGAAR
jgi:hypothetical protein